MKKSISILFLFSFLFLLCSAIQRKEAYAFRYFKKEIVKKDKVRSFEWGKHEQNLEIVMTSEGVNVVMGDQTYVCKSFVEKEHLKGTTGITVVDGVKRSCKIIIYKNESTLVPQIKISIFADGKANVTKLWFSQPANFRIKKE